MALVSRKVTTSLQVQFSFTFDDATANHSITVKQGDIVQVKFVGKDNEIIDANGKIKQLIATLPLENEDNPTMVLDASSEYDSVVFTIKSSEILDINAVIV
jgi:hypothetical protein